MADNADSVVLFPTVRYKPSNDFILLTFLPSEKVQTGTFYSLGYIMYTHNHANEL